ncbi:MAG: magnesium transporter [Lachnospiraceae bacterium]|nr:magnesium transporter [Lachnospiraceae bacterium]
MNVTNNTQNDVTEMMFHPDYKQEIVKMLRSNLTPKIKQERLLAYHERDIAAALEILRFEERNRLYHILNPETLAGILEYAENQTAYMSEISIQKRIAILSQFEIAEMAECIRNMDKADRAITLELLGDTLKAQVVLLNSFGEDEIGSKMTTNYISVHFDITVRQAMRELIAQAADNDNISTIYVLDENKMLFGAIDLKDLIIAREGTQLETIIMTSYPYVYANEQIDDCLGRIKDYSEDSIPVLASDNKMIGVLTSQNILELIDDELGEDYARLAGLSAEEDLNEPLKRSIRKRLPWLVILLGLGMVVSSVVGVFENVIAQLPLIIAFQSLILDMAGNVGTQSLAVTIRVLTDEKISRKQKLLLIAKEARIGFVNGLILGFLSFIFIGIYLFTLKNQSQAMAFLISACTGISLLLAMVLSSLSGTLIPLIFKKLGVDPAVASGPLITTINDLVAIITYYGLAWILVLNILNI